MGRRTCSSKEPLNRGAWTAQEDKLLRDFITLHGEGKWSKLPQRAGLKRCGKSCRLRWLNYLRPNIKRGNISKEEEDLIIRLHNLLGNRWSLIAGRIPGRTDNEIKNYWNTNLGKRVRDSPMSTSTTTGTEVNIHTSKSQSTLNNATPSLSLPHSNVFRTKASKCSKSLFIDPLPLQQQQHLQYKTVDREEPLLLFGDSPNMDNNNNISATNEMESDVYGNNEILSSFPSEEEKELSMDLLLDCDLGDVCFSDLLNLDFLDTCDLGYNNNNNNSEDTLPIWETPPLEFCLETIGSEEGKKSD